MARVASVVLAAVFRTIAFTPNGKIQVEHNGGKLSYLPQQEPIVGLNEPIVYGCSVTGRVRDLRVR